VYEIIKAHEVEIEVKACLPKRQRRQGKFTSKIPAYPRKEMRQFGKGEGGQFIQLSLEQ